MLEVAVYGLLLVLIAAALGFLVVWLRGRVLEHRLAILEAVADVSHRLAQIEQTLHGSDTAPVERKLDLLAERVKEVDARLASVVAGPPARSVAGPGHAEARSIRELAVDGLERRGFNSIRVLSEDAMPGGPVVVRVEAAREGASVKGSVFVTNGSVVELRLTPAFELFP